MTLKFKIDSVDSVDENIRNFYVEGDDGAHYLDVEGVVSKDRLDEFRSNNIKLMKKLETYDGVDLDKYKSMTDEIADLNEKLSKKNPDVDKIVEERVRNMRNELDSQISNLTEQNDLKDRQLETLLIDSAVRASANKHSVLPEAVEDVLLRAKSIFKVESGKAIPYDGKNVIYGKDADSPMSMDEWVKGLQKNNPHLFTPSSGSGSQGSNRFNGKVDPSKLSPLQKITQGLNG